MPPDSTGHLPSAGERPAGVAPFVVGHFDTCRRVKVSNHGTLGQDRRPDTMPGMNVVFVEPFFPANQRQFARALAESGATVIGVGEYPADALDDQLKGWLDHYQQISSVTDVDALTWAVRQAQDRLWVDRLEATVEAHTLPVAQVREACTIPGTSYRT